MNANFRPSAVPLITVDPYFSVWSFADKLTDDVTRHWTGRRNPMTGIIKIDGSPFIFMGKMIYSNRDYNEKVPVIPQTSLEVKPTSTVYTFENELVKLTLTFTSPLLLDDLKLMSRPVSYIRYNAETKTADEHDIKVYFDIGAETCTSTMEQKVRFGRTEHSLYMGNTVQAPLSSSGDSTLIDWGYLHLCRKDAFAAEYYCRRQFCENRTLEPKDETLEYGYESRVALAVICEGASDVVAVAYDDIHSINYFGDILDAWCMKEYGGFDGAVRAALADYEEVFARCEKFNAEFTAEMKKYGEDYAKVGALTYRQAIAAHKLARGKNDEVLFFSKECYSGGFIATLDVTYPSIPLFLLYNPELVKGMIRPIARMAIDEAWKFEFAPHDTGLYPLATGQKYSSKLERQMPVEECGNFILCVAAVCRAEGNDSFAKENADLMKKWADYLVQNGYKPGNQLCTDDFAGHLAHNCNLSLKAIAALAAYGKLTGETHYSDVAHDMAARFVTDAAGEKASKLTFDGAPDTWSMKYNLVWDKMLGLSLFSDDFYKKEIALYKEKANRFGVPLDSRKTYTKTDWLAWTTILTDDEKYMKDIYARCADMVSSTRQRVPVTDWYDTITAEQSGFQNRTVLGGFYINILADKWKKEKKSL